MIYNWVQRLKQRNSGRDDSPAIELQQTI